MTRTSMWTAVIALASVCIPAGWAQPAYHDVLPAGSVLRVRLDRSLSSRDARVGDDFSATVEPRLDGSGLPDGTQVIGSVAEVRRATNSRPAVMDLDFRTLRLPDGATYPINGTLASLDSRNVEHRSGRLMSRVNRSGSNRLKLIGYGAGAGFLISALTHGNEFTGALLGAAGGYVADMLNSKHKGHYSEVSLNDGAELGVRLDRRVALAPDAGPAGFGGSTYQGSGYRSHSSSSIQQSDYRDVLPQGSVLRVKLDSDLNSRDARVGDNFTASVQPSIDGSGLPYGTKVVGTVTALERPTSSQPAVMDVDFETLRLPDGATYPMAGTLTALDSKSIQRSASGRLVARSGSGKSHRNQIIGYGAGAGFLIAALSHGNEITGALLGAAGGYLAGMLGKDKLRNQEISLRRGTDLGVRLHERLALADTTARPSVYR